MPQSSRDARRRTAGCQLRNGLCAGSASAAELPRARPRPRGRHALAARPRPRGKHAHAVCGHRGAPLVAGCCSLTSVAWQTPANNQRKARARLTPEDGRARSPSTDQGAGQLQAGRLYQRGWRELAPCHLPLGRHLCLRGVVGVRHDRRVRPHARRAHQPPDVQTPCASRDAVLLALPLGRHDAHPGRPHPQPGAPLPPRSAARVEPGAAA
eukprot:5412150-Prymnesium_polylepis.1